MTLRGCGPMLAFAVACTWSSWHTLEAAESCEDRSDAVRVGADWQVPEFGTHYVTVIFGEAPLMQTMYVACRGAAPVGAAFALWEAPPTSAVSIALDPPGGIVWPTFRGGDGARLPGVAAALCAPV